MVLAWNLTAPLYGPPSRNTPPRVNCPTHVRKLNFIYVSVKPVGWSLWPIKASTGIPGSSVGGDCYEGELTQDSLCDVGIDALQPASLGFVPVAIHFDLFGTLVRCGGSASVEEITNACNAARSKDEAKICT